MIGNDIVDLKQAAIDSNWQRPRFLDKVFTENEQQLISNSENKHQIVWLLWSMKEAAYKVYVQQFEKRFFNPKRLECELVSLEKGSVTIDNEIYFTTSEITKDYVYTIAVLNQGHDFEKQCFKTEKPNYKLQSEVLKNKFLKTVATISNYDLNKLTIKKSKVGVPEVYCHTVKLPITFSLTHCGRFLAYVIH